MPPPVKRVREMPEPPVVALAYDPGTPNFANYEDRLRELGMHVLRVSPGDPMDLAGADALMLAGGVDIAPGLYGEEAAPETEPPNIPRDEHEIALVRRAIGRRIPLLAICRGHQVLNVALGGSLLQHIPAGDHRSYEVDGHWVSRWHRVSLTTGSRIASIYGTTEMEVNSRHHQAVTPDRLAPGLHATAHSPDGLVEAVESADGSWVIGVQWHPERPEPERPGFRERSLLLFQAFAAAARERHRQALATP